MAMFPMYVSLQNRKCLVVGGGTIGYHKAKILAEYGAQVTVVAKHFNEFFMENEKYHLINKLFEPDDIRGMALVVAATPDEQCNHLVSRCCRQCGIPVNVVDDPEECDFYFPSIVRRGDVVIGISTHGKSPTLAKYLRSKFETILPDNLGDITDKMYKARCKMKNDKISMNIKRKRLDAIVSVLMKEGWMDSGEDKDRY